ncbi:MAG: ACP S-malonyltransferase [Deltaproteobacteria bacterium]|nr:ACP S-malonyltransferase [Deltaproteobacteria bacterium]
MTVLVDHNLKGQALVLWGTLAAEGWLGLFPLRLVAFEEVGLPINSNDRAVWRFAQAKGMILLTGNRSRKGPDSLEQTIREENAVSSLPVITVASVARLDERSYREQCASRLVEIVLDLNNYLGTGRLFIP